MRFVTITAFSLGCLYSIVAAQSARFLIYSKTKGYRHESIPTAIECLKAAGPTYSVSFDSTEDATQFNNSTLSQYDGVMFLMNTDDPTDNILNTTQVAAFQWFLNKGGNFVAVHAASDCLQKTPVYMKELGAIFNGHPALAPATFIKVEPDHPTVKMLPDPWTYPEEVYSFQSDPRRNGARVVLTVQGSESDAKTQGSPHPIAWYQEKGAGVSDPTANAGRSFYTSLGHLNTTWQDPTFMAHMMAGVMWTLYSNTTKATNSSGFVGDSTAFPYKGYIPPPPTPNNTDSNGGGAEAKKSDASPSFSPSSKFGAVLLGSLALLVLPFGF